MCSDILRQAVIVFGYITRNIQIAAVAPNNLIILHKAGIAGDFTSMRVYLDDSLDVLLTQTVFIAVFFVAEAGVNEENTLPLLGVFFVNQYDASGNARTVKEVSWEADDSFYIVLA